MIWSMNVIWGFKKQPGVCRVIGAFGRVQVSQKAPLAWAMTQQKVLPCWPTDEGILLDLFTSYCHFYFPVWSPQTPYFRNLVFQSCKCATAFSLVLKLWFWNMLPKSQHFWKQCLQHEGVSHATAISSKKHRRASEAWISKESGNFVSSVTQQIFTRCATGS